MTLSLAEAAAAEAARVLESLGSSPTGLSEEEARRRLRQVGPNAVRSHGARPLAVLARQLNSPLLLLLVAAALVSIVVGEHADAGIILAIVGLSVGLGFVNEYRSERAIEALHERIRHTALTLRDGRAVAVDVTELVPGDLVRLGVGDVVPADLRLLEADGLQCDEAVLTGEPVPEAKTAKPSPTTGPLDLPSCALMGTVVQVVVKRLVAIEDLGNIQVLCTSAAGASLFLGFLPMLPTQILLNNLLYDIGEMTIPTDRVDPELLERPSRWDTAFIRRFMAFFGPISSLFDFATFGVLLGVLHAGAVEFRSGWFVESLATQTLVIFVIRTRRTPSWRSRPSLPLLVTALACATVGVALPFSPLAGLFGFTALPPAFMGILAGMVAVYLALAEAGKAWFYRPRAGGEPLAVERPRRVRRIERSAARWSRRATP